MQPTPLSRRPNRGEIDWLRECPDVDENVSVEQVEGLIETWAKKPAVSVKSDADWIKIAQAARASRSLRGEFFRVWVAGPLFITRMKPGSIRVNKLLKFNDTGEELRQLLTESHHPLAQINPCSWCDSGLPALDCCLRDDLDDPCGCSSGKTFGDCCVVTDRDAVPERLWT